MWKLIREAIGILLLPLLWVVAKQAYALFLSHFDFKTFQWAIFGFLGYLVLHAILLVLGALGFIQTFEHEMAHAAMGCLFFRVPDVFKATATKGGETGPYPNNFLIVLAPYFLPLFTVPLLLLKYLLLPSNSLPAVGHSVLDFSIGFTTAFHYLGLLKEYRPRQTDLRRTGYIFSFVMVSLLNILFLMATFCLVLGDPPLLLSFFKDAWASAKECYPAVWQKLKSLPGLGAGAP